MAASLGGTAYPKALDVKSAFGEAHGSASTYLSAKLPLQPVLGLFAGGKRVWGTFPYHEAAFVGGGETVRGYREQRFAGDAAAWGSAELRLFLTRSGFIVPGRIGVLGLTDAGRVWLKGDSPGGWAHLGRRRRVDPGDGREGPDLHHHRRARRGDAHLRGSRLPLLTVDAEVVRGAHRRIANCQGNAKWGADDNIPLPISFISAEANPCVRRCRPSRTGGINPPTGTTVGRQVISRLSIYYQWR